MSTLNTSYHAINLAAGLARLQAPTDSSSARLSSGQRIDRPAVDVAGVGLAAKLDGQQRRLEAAQVNLQNGVSRMQVTSSHLDTVADVVTRLGELSMLGSNATQSPADRKLYEAEFTQLQNQLRQTVGGTTAEIGGRNDVGLPLGVFNGDELFGPGAGETLVIGLQADDKLTLPALDFRSGALAALFRQDANGEFTLKLDDANISTSLGAALDQTAAARATVGAMQSRLEFAAKVATTASANHEAALSVIVDTDVATETTALSRLQILNEGHTAMLAQAREATAKLLPLLSRG